MKRPTYHPRNGFLLEHKQGRTAEKSEFLLKLEAQQEHRIADTGGTSSRPRAQLRIVQPASNVIPLPRKETKR